MIAAIVLAAGGAKRFGRQKLIEPFYFKPIIRRAVDAVAASGVDDIIVVTGTDERVRRVLAGGRARCIVNDAAASGMGTSIAAGIAAVAPETRAAMIVLGDQPGVPPKAFRAVLAAYRERSPAIVVPVYWWKTRGHPVLFDASVFPELRALTGDRGARDVINRDPARVLQVAIGRPAPRDIDTSADAASIMNLLHLIQ